MQATPATTCDALPLVSLNDVSKSYETGAGEVPVLKGCSISWTDAFTATRATGTMGKRAGRWHGNEWTGA